MMTDTHAIDALFTGKDSIVRETYDRLLEVLRRIGPVTAEPKKTSIHLVKNVGFAGVHPRKNYMYLNLRTEHPIKSSRVHKTEQVSKNRYHNEIKLEKPVDIDEELHNWLTEAYSLG